MGYMLIFPFPQVKFMKPPPNVFSSIRFTLPLSAEVVFHSLDHLAQHVSLSKSPTEAIPAPTESLDDITKRLEDYAFRFLESTAEKYTTDLPAILESVLARTTEVTLQLRSCTIGLLPVIDTLHTPTLASYRADWNGTDQEAETIRASIQQKQDIRIEHWLREKEILDVDLEDTRDKSRLVAAIRALYELDRNPDLQKQNANRLLCRLFPELEGAFSDCHIAVSATLFYFVLPDIFCDEEPMNSNHAGFASFRSRLKKFKQWQFSQFPMFGFLRGDEVDPLLIEELADASGLAPSYIRRELGRVIGFLPLAFAERYLVHDVWGHGWQASMLRLEGLYQQLAAFDQNFDWNSTVVMSDRSKLRLSDCLHRTHSGWKINDERFAEYMQLWIWNRIPTAMTPLIAELVADLFEHKIYWTDPHLYPNLQTTSILPNVPAKLDLMLEDLNIYFKQIFKALDLFCQRSSYRQRFVSEMVTDGIKREDAERIVEEIKTRIENWRMHEVASKRLVAKNRGEIEVNLYGYLEHHITLLSAISSIVARQIADLSTATAGMRRWNDWFALLIAVYFEQDPAEHFWKLPQFLRRSNVAFFEKKSLVE